MRASLLRNALLLDAALLFVLGALLILVPRRVEGAFGFQDLPAGVSFILGLWGCGLAAMGIGYVVAASNPIRHLIWIQVGIARGALECVLGLAYLERGTVSFSQAGFGIIAAAFVTVAYLLLYPRQPRPLVSLENSVPTPPKSQ